MKRFGLVLLFLMAACSGSMAAGPVIPTAAKAAETGPRHPVQLCGRWFMGSFGNYCWLTLRADHTLTLQTAGCISGERAVTATWTQEANKIVLVAIVDLVVEPNTFPKEHFKSSDEFWSQEALFYQQEFVKKLFGSGLIVLEYKGETVLAPQESLIYIRAHGSNQERCFKCVR